MKIKRCVGVLLYDDNNRIFLMTSKKWKGYLIPGGRIEESETEIDALKREINEELSIRIYNIIRLNDSVKLPSNDFYDPDTKFEFTTFYAKAFTTRINPNKEISSYGWFEEKDALNLPLLDSTRLPLEDFIKNKENYFKKTTYSY